MIEVVCLSIKYLCHIYWCGFVFFFHKFQQADFTIECQARNDSTLAPLEFTLKAKDASTPCVSAQDKDVRS